MAKNKLPAGLINMLTAIAATSVARQRSIDAGLDALAAGAGDPSVTVLEIDMSSKESVGSQIERQIAKAKAAHREECDTCREEYEAEQAAKKAKKQAQPQPSNEVGASPAGTEAKDRLVVGYMVFQGERPLPETFTVDEGECIGGVKDAFKEPMVRALLPVEYYNSLSVRPVFGN